MFMKRLVLLCLVLVGLSFSVSADHGNCESFSQETAPDFEVLHPSNASLTEGCDFLVEIDTSRISGIDTSSERFHLQLRGPFDRELVDSRSPNSWMLNPKDSWTDGGSTVLLMEIPGTAQKSTGVSSSFSAEMRPGTYSVDIFYDGEDARRYIDSGHTERIQLTCPSHADCDPVNGLIAFSAPETCRTYSGGVPLKLEIDSELLEDGGRFGTGLTQGTAYVGGRSVKNFHAGEVVEKSLSSTGQIMVELYNPETSASIYFRGPIIESSAEGYQVLPAPRTYTGSPDRCGEVEEESFDDELIGMKKEVYSLGQQAEFRVNSDSTVLEEGYRVKVTNPSGSTICRSALNPGNYSCTLPADGVTGDYTAEIVLDSSWFRRLVPIGGDSVYSSRTFTVVDGLQPWEQECQNQGFDIMSPDSRTAYSNKADCISSYIVPTCFKPDPGADCRNIGQNICRDLLEKNFNAAAGECRS